MGLDVDAEPPPWSALPHDRHDRGRAGVRPARPRASRRPCGGDDPPCRRGPRGGHGRSADRRHRLRHVRARRPRHGRDPPRRDALGRLARTRSRERPGIRSRARSAARRAPDRGEPRGRDRSDESGDRGRSRCGGDRRAGHVATAPRARPSRHRPRHQARPTGATRWATSPLWRPWPGGASRRTAGQRGVRRQGAPVRGFREAGRRLAAPRASASSCSPPAPTGGSGATRKIEWPA
jgi:hypothetical protein